MEITGIIKHVLEARSGVSSRTGKAWMRQDYVLEIPGQYPSHFVFTVSGEDMIRGLALKEGEEVTVRYNVDAHEYNGRWYGENRAFGVSRAGRESVSEQSVKLPSSGTDDLPY